MKMLVFGGEKLRPIKDARFVIQRNPDGSEKLDPKTKLPMRALDPTGEPIREDAPLFCYIDLFRFDENGDPVLARDGSQKFVDKRAYAGDRFPYDHVRNPENFIAAGFATAQDSSPSQMPKAAASKETPAAVLKESNS